MMSARRPANRLMSEISSGILEYENEREERRKMAAIARCGTVAPWGPKLLAAVAERYPSLTACQDIGFVFAP